MKTLIHKLGLTSVLLALFIGCVQPPAAPSSEIETSDEAGDTVTTQAVPTNGLKGDYYDNVDFTGILKTRYDANVNRTWNANAPISGIQPTTYSVRWTGQVMPAFSQTYTFFVTSSDGARLMVNGQVIVNDWVDGSSRVRSGTVALQANTKYDIRIEYYRNATNAGRVKLEWQSSSRTKQVVPQLSFFPTGSNAQSVLTILKNDPRFVSLAINLNESDSIAALNGAVATLFVSSTDGLDSILAIYKDGLSRFLFRSSVRNGEMTLTNLADGRTFNGGSLSEYFKTDGSLIEDKRQFAIGGFKSLLLGNYAASVRGIVRQSSGVKPLNLPDYAIVPESACLQSGGACDTPFSAFQGAAIVPATFGVDGFFLVGGAVALKKEFGWWRLFGAANTAWDVSQVGVKFIDLADKKDALDYCINQSCPPTVSVIFTPNPLQAQLRQVKSVTLSISNSANAGAYLTAVNSDGVFSGGVGVSVLRVPINLSIRPGETIPITGNVECLEVRTTSVSATFTSSDPIRPSPSVENVLDCVSPQISVTPNPLKLLGQVGTTTNGNLRVQNTGSAPLTYAVVTSNLPSWLSVTSGGTGTVAAGTSDGVIRFSATCESTPNDRNATIFISSNVTSNPGISVEVQLRCVAGQVATIAFAAVQWRHPVGGYTIPCANGNLAVEARMGYVYYLQHYSFSYPGIPWLYFSHHSGITQGLEVSLAQNCNREQVFETQPYEKIRNIFLPKADDLFSQWRPSSPSDAILSSPWSALISDDECRYTNNFAPAAPPGEYYYDKDICFLVRYAKSN